MEEELTIVIPKKNSVVISNNADTPIGQGSVSNLTGFLENVIIKADNYGILNIVTDDGIVIYNGWIEAGVHVFPIRFQAKVNDGDAWFTYNAEKLLLDNNTINITWEKKESTCEVIFRCQKLS